MQWPWRVTRTQLLIFIQKLGTPNAVTLHDPGELGAQSESDHPAIKLGRRPEAFGILRRHFAEHAATMFFTEDLNHTIEMTRHHRDAFLKPRLGRTLTGCQIVLGVLEDPRVVKSAA